MITNRNPGVQLMPWAKARPAWWYHLPSNTCYTCICTHTCISICENDMVDVVCHSVLTQGLLWLSSDCAKALLAVYNVEVNQQNKLGDTPLHNAAWKGHADIVEMLLEKGGWVCVKVYFRGARGCFHPPPPWKLAFPTFNMGLPPFELCCYIFSPSWTKSWNKPCKSTY